MSIRFFLNRFIAVGISASLPFVAITAQDLKSAYFQQGFFYRHLMNPAFAAERSYLGMPGMGNVDISANGNVGLSDFLYEYNDPTDQSILTTFMHESVDRETFLGKLHPRNKISANVDLSLLSSGFALGKGFAQVNVGFHSRNNVSAPYELFEFIKSSELGGAEPQEYRIRNFRMQTTNYADLSLNYSHPVNERLRIGGSMKILFGAVNLDTRFSDLRIAMHEKEWLINAQGYIHASSRNVSFRQRNGNEISGIDFGGFNVNGLGAAVDFGVSWQLTPTLNLSAAILDLGMIGWFNTLTGRTRNEVYSFTGFDKIGVGSDSSYPTIEDQFDNLGDDLVDLVKVYQEGTIRKYTAIGTTLNVGGEYRFPSYKRLSLGLLSSTHINRPYSWTELRGSVNIYPAKWFEATLSGTWSTYGPGFGFLLNFHPRRFNIFVGTDFMFTEITPQFIPVNNLNANISMGINFAFGR